MTVPVIDLNDLDATPTTITVDIITTYMMRQFLSMHLDWSFIAPVIGQGDWASLRFAELYSDFIAHRLPDITRAVRAAVMEYNPALTYFKHEHGDIDAIKYGRTNVTNSGGLTESTARAGKTGTASMGSPDTDGYKAVSVNTTTSTGTTPTTTTSVTTYDSDTPAELSNVSTEGDNVTVSGSAQSAKSTDSGTDTHSRDLFVDGSDALHTTVDMVKNEIELRLHVEVGEMLLDIFKNQYLFLTPGGDDDE